MKKIIICSMILIAVILIHRPLTGEESADIFTWKVKGGGRGVYTSGISEPASYYQVLGGIEFLYAAVSLEGQVNRFLGYQVADGNGNYEYTDISEGYGAVTVRPLDSVSIGGAYKYATGDMDYTKKGYTVSMEISGGNLSFLFEYASLKSEYLFDTIAVETDRKDLSASLSIEVSDDTGLDIEYDRSSLAMNAVDYDYTRHTLRVGFLHGFNDSIFFMAGILGGADSGDYIIIGGDAGLVVYLYSRVKVTGLCLAERFVAPAVESVESSTKKSSPMSVSGNPYLSSEMIGESYTSLMFSVGAVISY